MNVLKIISKLFQFQDHLQLPPQFQLVDFQKNFIFMDFFPEKKKIIIEDLKFLSKLDCSIVFCISKKFNKFIPFIKENF